MTNDFWVNQYKTYDDRKKARVFSSIIIGMFRDNTNDDDYAVFSKKTNDQFLKHEPNLSTLWPDVTANCEAMGIDTNELDKRLRK